MKTEFNYFTTPDNLSIRYSVCYPTGTRTAGTIILLQGRAEFLEKYQETCEDLCRRNFLVFSMDWRGQGLSQRMLPSRKKGYVKTYRDYLDDLNQFVSRVIEPSSKPPYFVLAHSMGAHVALRFLYENPSRIQKAVLVSPMIDIQLPFNLKGLIKTYVFLLDRLRMGKCTVAGKRAYMDAETDFSKNRLTTDRNRFHRQLNLLENNPDLDSREITYGWLAATFRSIDHLSASGYAEAIDTPTLLFSAGLDRVVSNQAQKRFCGQMKVCTLKLLPGAKHEILMEMDAIRENFWHEFDQFINLS